MNCINKLAIGALAVSAAASAQAGFPWGEIADDIQMISGGILKSVDIAYAGFNFNGDESLTLNLYVMDGAPTPGSFGFATPGSLLFSSTVDISETVDGLATFEAGDAIVELPDYIGVGLVFNGINFPSESAGPLLFNPIELGSSFDDYWVKDYAGDPDWALYTFGGDPAVNFGIRVVDDVIYSNLRNPLGVVLIPSAVVPEPGTWVAMIGFGAIAGSMAFRRFRGSK